MQRRPVVGAGPREAAPDITREFRQRMIGEEPHRDAVSSETAGNANADVSAADNQGTGRRVRKTPRAADLATDGDRAKLMSRSRSAASDSGACWRNGSRRSSARPRDPRPRPITDRVTRRAANPAPAMKRSKGPKLATAAEPTKCRPPTLDSNPADKIGQTAVPRNAAAQARVQDIHLIDIDSITGRQQNMVDASRAVIQRQCDAIAVAPRIQDAACLRGPAHPASGIAATALRWRAGSVRSAGRAAVRINSGRRPAPRPAS